MTTTSTSQPGSSLTDEQLDAIKTRQQATWSSGDFAVIGTTLQLVGELLCEAVDIDAGWQVLDVAAGNGNASLAAARRNADVTATDYVPELLERAAARAAADGMPLTTRVADAEALPYTDRTFDAVLSVFGVMFAPRQERAAAELVRVCRAGGRIGLANWTPDSFVAAMFETVARYVTPPAIPSAFRWGVESDVVDLLGTDVSGHSASKREFVFRFRSAEEFVDTFRTYYGPTNRAFAALEADGQDALENDLLTLTRSWNRSTTGALAVPGEYLELVASVR
ncbi:MAG TPA: class I SAM-dependent methyltransferase [Acidimicrobiia bacterium]|nr:class I SAM-dependent methyltransferase [Acidimicrobiia bacterium]